MLVGLLVFASVAQGQELEADLSAPSGELGNELGLSIAIDGDRVVAGAPRSDQVGVGYGIPSSVSSTAVVNTPNLVQGRVDIGAVGVYAYDGAEWQIEQYINAPYGGPPDAEEGLRNSSLFGSSVAISGNRMLVGAPGRYFARFDPNADYQDRPSGRTYSVKLWLVGEVLAYEFEQGAWVLKQTMAPPGDFVPQDPNRPTRYPGYTVGQSFGARMALGGDFVAIAAPGNLEPGANGGFGRNYPVRIFWYGTNSLLPCATKSGTFPSFPAFPLPDIFALPYIPPPATGTPCWLPVQPYLGVDRGVLEPPAPTIGFGTSIAMSKDGALLAVGAPFESNPSVPYDSNAAGAVYLYERVIITTNDVFNGYELKQKLLPGDPGPGDLFGASVAIDGRRVAVGASLKTCSVGLTELVPIDRICERDPSTGDLAAGAVYVFEELTSPTGSTFFEDAKISEGGGPLYLGASLTLRGDDLFAGAPGYSAEGFYQGAVFHYRKQNGTWRAATRIDTPIGLNQEGFGLSLSAAGVSLAIGDPGRTRIYTDDGFVVATDTGSAFVYELPAVTGSGAGPQPLLPSPEPSGPIAVGVALACLAMLARLRAGAPRIL